MDSQKCQMPALDPWDPEIRKYLNKEPFMEKCRNVRHARVKGDTLYLNRKVHIFVFLFLRAEIRNPRIQIIRGIK